MKMTRTCCDPAVKPLPIERLSTKIVRSKVGESDGPIVVLVGPTLRVRMPAPSPGPTINRSYE